MSSGTSPGTLYIVATPIGNLEDMTFRAVNTLNSVDLIAAEDTRHSKKLLSHYQIAAPLVSYHDHNEQERSADLIRRLKTGKNIALITDAGTPCISDPGYVIVKEAASAGIPVCPIPGCSAAIAGISAAGLPTDSFLFIGFLPKKMKRRKEVLQTIAILSATVILYESPRRIKALLDELRNGLGNVKACLAREMTKRHEEYIRGTLEEISGQLAGKEQIKGECVLMVHPVQAETRPDDDALESLIRDRLAETGHPGTSRIAAQLAKDTGISRKKIYAMILNLQKEH